MSDADTIFVEGYCYFYGNREGILEGRTTPSMSHVYDSPKAPLRPAALGGLQFRIRIPLPAACLVEPDPSEHEGIEAELTHVVEATKTVVEVPLDACPFDLEAIEEMGGTVSEVPLPTAQELLGSLANYKDEHGNRVFEPMEEYPDDDALDGEAK